MAAGFRRLFHSDWSMRPEGRWVASAIVEGGRWRAGAPAPVGPLDAFVDRLSGPGPTLAGFDFPIGLPTLYGAKTGFDGFLEALPAFGTGDWSRFFEVAATKEEIGLERPFYPARPGGTALAHLLAGHDVGTVAAITRQCERGGNGMTPAGCLFWTLGAKQVGKAALHGWQHVIRPAVVRGAKLWPFDGPLPVLAEAGGLTLAETYPGDAYGQIGLSLQGLSKRRQNDRASLAADILRWVEARPIDLDAALRGAILEGFPQDQGADDGFDALIGLLAMIAVVSGARPDGAPRTEPIERWEGWILGRRQAEP